MPSSPPLTVLGTGRMGSSLCRWIAASHLPLAVIVTRSLARARRLQRETGAAEVARLDAWKPTAGILLLAVPDDAIAATAQRLARVAADWQHITVLHTSGAQSSETLAELRNCGAAVGSMHPLMTFPRNAAISPEGLVFALEGDARAVRAARQLVRHWRGRALQLDADQKAAWHLAATLACPLSVVPYAAALHVLRQAGLTPSALRSAQRGLLRLLQQTTGNLAAGLEAAWTGPFARGDRHTIRTHQEVLEPSPALAEYYRAAAAAAMTLLPSRAPEEILEEVKRPEKGKGSSRGISEK